MAIPGFTPLTALSAPPQACLPSTPQALLNFAAQYLGVIFPTNYTQIVISETTPAAEDQDKIWLKVDSGGAPIGFFLYDSGAWEPITPQNVFFATDTGVANAISVNVSNYPYSALQSGLFIVKVAAENTGATTLTVNSFAAVPVKIGGADPYAAALKANFYYAFAYTGTGSTFEVLNPTPEVKSPTLVAQFAYQEASGTVPAVIPAGDTTIPINTTVSSSPFATLGGNAVALGEGSYFIQAGVFVIDTTGPAAGGMQLTLKNGGADLNWQDGYIDNVNAGAQISTSAVLEVAAGGSASITLQMRVEAGGQLTYGANQTSARAERIAYVSILKLA